MSRIEISTVIQSPIQTVFDMARSIDFHCVSIPDSNEKAIEGTVTGLIKLGESVTWEAKHLGFRQKLTSKITQFDRPRHFRDSMVSGAFKRFDHDHLFEPVSSTETIVTDIFEYDSPFGFIGQLFNYLFLNRYMKNVLSTRLDLLKISCENDDWKKYIPGGWPDHF